MDIPVFLVTGFLESGKTSFIMETMNDEEFFKGERTLLICCEEGETEFDMSLLKKKGVSLIHVESSEELTEEFLRKCNTKYIPQRVIIEYNGMWKMDILEKLIMPKKWVLAQMISTVDATTFSMYLANMRPMMVEQHGNSDLILFNRCNSEINRNGLRRSMKIINRKAQFIYESTDGSVDSKEDDLPFDMDAEVIEILDDDYGLWYMDASDSPDKYDGKTIRIKGMVYRPEGFEEGAFVPGRFAMTCCADDMAFVGFVCKTPKASEFFSKEWVLVTAKIKCEFHKGYKTQGPVLYALSVEKTTPPDEKVVYFS